MYSVKRCMRMDCLKPSYSQNYGNVVGLTCYPKWADFSNTTIALCRDKIYLRNLNFSITLLNIAFYYNRPRSIYQYSNMAPRLSGQTSIFGVVFFVSKSPLGIERQKKLEKFAILTRKPRSHARILIYRTWPIGGS